MKDQHRNSGTSIRRVALRLRPETQAGIRRLAAGQAFSTADVVRGLVAKAQEPKTPAQIELEAAFEQRSPGVLRYITLLQSTAPAVRPVAAEIRAENTAKAEAGMRKARRSLGRAAWARRDSFDRVEASAKVRLEAGDWSAVGAVAQEIRGTLNDAVAVLVDEALAARRAKARAEASRRMEAAHIAGGAR